MNKERNLKKYTVVNDNDGNDTFEVEATDANDAASNALLKLGWWIAENDSHEDDSHFIK